MISRWLSTVSLTVVLTGLASAVAGEVPPPANAAAKFRWDTGHGNTGVEHEVREVRAACGLTGFCVNLRWRSHP